MNNFLSWCNSVLNLFTNQCPTWHGMAWLLFVMIQGGYAWYLKNLIISLTKKKKKVFLFLFRKWREPNISLLPACTYENDFHNLKKALLIKPEVLMEKSLLPPSSTLNNKRKMNEFAAYSIEQYRPSRYPQTCWYKYIYIKYFFDSTCKHFLFGVSTCMQLRKRWIKMKKKKIDRWIN